MFGQDPRAPCARPAPRSYAARMSDTQLLEDVVSAALKAGAEAAEAVVAERRSLSVTVRLGDLEEVEREESRDLGLRVFIGKQQATVSASDISPATRARLVERAVAMARLAPEDRYTGLAPEALLARGPFPTWSSMIRPSARPRRSRPRPWRPRPRAGGPGRHQFRGRLGQLVDRPLELPDLARLQRRPPGQRLLAVRGRHRLGRGRHGAGRRRPHDPLARGPPGAGRHRPHRRRAGGEAAGRAQAGEPHRAGDLREPHRRLHALGLRGRDLRPVGRARRLLPEGQARPARLPAGLRGGRRPVPAARPGLGALRRRGAWRCSAACWSTTAWSRPGCSTARPPASSA